MENNNTEIDLLKDITLRRIYFSAVEELKYVKVKSIGYNMTGVPLNETLNHLNQIQNYNHTEIADYMKQNYFKSNGNLNSFNDFTFKFDRDNHKFNTLYPIADGISSSGMTIGYSKSVALHNTGVGLYAITPDIISNLPNEYEPDTAPVYYIISIEFDMKNKIHINKYQYKENKFTLVQGEYDILKESSGVENLILETIFNIDI